MNRVTAAYLLAVLSAVLLLLGGYAYGQHTANESWEEALTSTTSTGIVLTP